MRGTLLKGDSAYLRKLLCGSLRSNFSFNMAMYNIFVTNHNAQLSLMDNNMQFNVKFCGLDRILFLHLCDIAKSNVKENCYTQLFGRKYLLSVLLISVHFCHLLPSLPHQSLINKELG